MNLFQRITRKLHRISSREIILVLGDSHAMAFNHYSFLLKFPRIFFRIYSVGGATVSGLKNPNSKTQAINIFQKALEQKDYNRIIVCLGEVDTGFVIWYQAEKYNKVVSTMLSQTVDKYQSFLLELKNKADLIVISTPLPTIEDGDHLGEVANLRKSITATQLERTNLTLEFNQKMHAFCLEQHINFIDLDKQCLGNNGIVSNEVKSKNKRDHHYDNDKYARIITNKLNNILKR